MIGSPPASNGLRTVCDLGLARVSVDGNLDPGDIVLFRTSDNPLSRLITALDGYWCHSAIYVGAGIIVHATTVGVARSALKDLAPDYGEGIAFARPNLPPEQRVAAAHWADELAEPANHDVPARYSGRDLGLAWTLLRSAGKAEGLARLPAERFDTPAAFMQTAARKFSNFESTCSGLVFRAYREVGHELKVVPAPGIVKEGDRLRLRNESDSVVTDLVGPPVRAAYSSDVQSKVAFWRTKLGLLWQAAKAWMDLGADGSIAIEQGVTPADLWCSPSIAERGFLKATHREYALAACAEC